MIRKTIHLTYKLARRLVIGVIGTTVILVGIVMLVLPGPAVVVIPLGLGILGAEFAWARRWLHTLKDKAKGALDGLNRKKRSRSSSRPDPGE